MKLYLNINDGEHRIECQLPKHGPQYAKDMTQEEYEDLWEYHHPATNAVISQSADRKLYDRLLDTDKIQEQWFEHKEPA